MVFLNGFDDYNTWLLVVVIVNMVSAASIYETEDSIKSSYKSLLKNIININEKRINAMKHINKEKDFRLRSYLTKIHQVNDDSHEYERNEKPYLSAIDMRRNLNIVFREINTQSRPVIDVETKISQPFKKITFETPKNNVKITELLEYQGEPSILDIINQNLKDSSENINNRMLKDIIDPPNKNLGKSGMHSIVTKLTGSYDNSEMTKKTMVQKDHNTINIPRRYIQIPISILNILSKTMKLDDPYQEKGNKMSQKEDIINLLRDIIKHMVKDKYENMQRKIVKLDDENQEHTKCGNDKHRCIIYGKIGKIGVNLVKCEDIDASKKKSGNLDLVHTFDDGKEDGVLLNPWKNKGLRHNTRKRWRGCGRSAAKSCRTACFMAHRNFCNRYMYKCTRKGKKAFRRECKKACRNVFVAYEYSDEE